MSPQVKKPLYFKTAKGTELPLMELQGKPYLQVAHRILWFREDHPDWVIECTFEFRYNDVTKNLSYILAKATICDETGKVRSTSHRIETKVDDLEKAETGAIGRALGFLGYGTQFATDIMEEGVKLADAPIEPAKQVINHAPVKTLQPQVEDASPVHSTKAGSFSKINKVYSLAKQASWKEADLNMVLRTGFNVDSVNKLNDNQYNQLLNIFKQGKTVQAALATPVEVSGKQ